MSSFESMKKVFADGKASEEKKGTKREMKPVDFNIDEATIKEPIAVRNNSSKNVRDDLLNRLSLPLEGDHIHGRYVAISTTDIPAFVDFAKNGGFHVERHDLPKMTILELMVDNVNRKIHFNGKR